MTFVIINEPIGMKMFLKIVLEVLLLLPIVILISYYFGKYLSDKFSFIQKRLKMIEQEDFTQKETHNIIQEINQINQSMNLLSTQMDNLIKDLKQKNQNLSNLLISMAHDVKTPITILNGYIDEIEDGLVDEEKLPSILTSMKQEVEFLNELTVDMLNFISSMQAPREKDKINLYALLEDEILPIIIRNNQVEFINNIDENFVIEFNKIDLKKICINLLSNAYRHTKHGYIKVEAKYNVVCFQNSGEEIKEEYKEKIFEPFFTISKSKNRKQSGFGLGLSIVKNLSSNNGYECYLKESSFQKTSFCLAIK
jgi:two-component system, OmpR family, sensor histidine kinase SaeS